jgi:hypothetical protein
MLLYIPYPILYLGVQFIIEYLYPLDSCKLDMVFLNRLGGGFGMKIILSVYIIYLGVLLFQFQDIISILFV